MMHWYEQWKPEFQRLGHINVGSKGKAQCGLRKGQTELKEGIRGSVRPEKMNTTYYYQILVGDTVSDISSNRHNEQKQSLEARLFHQVTGEWLVSSNNRL